MTATLLGRSLLAGLTVLALTAMAPAWADDTETKTGTETADTKSEETKSDDAAAKDAPAPKHVIGDIPLGDENAPVTIIEYASFTCPHCASFHNNVWDKLKENYIDTGKVRFIMREVYFDKYGLWASMTARCAGPEGFHPMVDTYLKTQNVWTRAPDVGQAIQQIGRRAGLSEERLRACLTDRDYAKALLDDYKKNAAADDVRSTPTFVINGEKAVGSMSYEEFAKLVDAKLN